MNEDREMSIRQIGIELDRIEARVDELERLADETAIEIQELTVKVQFYGLIMESWTDEDE
jgi:hypothetical protein